MKKLSEEQIQEVIKDYKRHNNSNIIAKKFKVNSGTILRYLKNRNVLLRREINKTKRICNICNTEKNISEFKTDSTYPSGKHYICKICDKINSRDRRLKLKFGISSLDYDKMFKDQKGKCSICNKPEFVMDPRSHKIRRLCIDHSHKTGKIRSLLCQTCNMTLGNINDDIELLQKMIEYLRKHE